MTGSHHGNVIRTATRRPTVSFSVSPRRSSQVVLLSRFKFALVWLSLLSIHGLSLGYFVVMSRVYQGLLGTYLASLLDYYELGLPTMHYPALSIIHLIFGCVHSILGGLMVLGSLVRRQLVFHPLQGRTITWQRGDQSSCGDLLSRLGRIYTFLNGRHGLFGVENPYFDLVLLTRECLGMFLQSYQAYRLSRFVPRLWLNRVYVALVVLHCWSTPLIRIVFKRRVVLSRLYLLLGAALLDLFSTIGLAVILLTTYYKDYDPEIGGFPQSFWYNDEWVVNFFNEFHLVLVVSWIDLLNRILFYTGIIGAMENIKELLEQTRARARLQVGPTTTALATKEPSVGPVLRSNTLVTPPRHRFDRVAHTGLVIWGLVVLCLHVHGQTQQQLSQCLMQVRPWTATRPACVLLSMDCSQANVLGHEDDITPLWEVADPTAVTRIVIRHCPELRMPTILQTFHRLDTLKLYNCTIVNWADSAAITNQHHPVLTAIFVVRVNFPNGQLPPGMVSSDYPQSVYDSEFIVTNLRTLPDDLDTKWPHGGSIYIEMSQLEQFPSVLLRLEPTDLSLAVNHLTEFPVEAMQIPDMVFLSLAANPISTLETIPYTDVVDNGVLANLKLMETNVSSLPRWLDSLLDRGSPSQPSVNLHHSPFCWYVRELKNGTRLHFPAVDTTPEDELATVMLLSDVAAITQSVSCRYYFVTLYPLESEDEWSALTPVDRPSK